MGHPVTLRDAEALVGLPYRPGRADCMHLAVRAQAELFGRVVRWPHDGRHPVDPEAQRAAVREGIHGLARPLDAADVPGTGDAVLWIAAPGLPREHFHIGTLFVQWGEHWVLHTSVALGASVLQRLATCTADGLRFEGFYRWL